MLKHRRLPATEDLSPRSPIIGLAIPALLIWLVWLAAMIELDLWSLFLSHGFMSITMAVGSFIAGATSEGGGAVAFPVMTLVFGLSPAVARDFSLMIQTVGMNAAAFSILWQRIPIERRALVWASLGGTVGVIGGLHWVRLPPDFAKLFFVSTWLAFAFALFWLNRRRGREVHEQIADFRPTHAAMLVVTGVAGGVISSITGSGLDIATFTLLTLWLRLSEKVATPTSVILMGINATVGFAWKGLIMPGGLETDAWSYWIVCVPIVVVGAPLGAWTIKSRSRQFVAGLLYASIGLQAVWAAHVLDIFARPTLLAFSGATFVIGLLLFRAMAHGGDRRLRTLRKRRAGDPAPAHPRSTTNPL